MTADSDGKVRVFHIQPQGAVELDAIPQRMPAQGFVWIACTRATFSARLGALQSSLQSLAGQQLVDLHVSDLLNAQLPSHYDYTSQYDVLVFRRLSATQCDTGGVPSLASLSGPGANRAAPPVLRRINTSPVGFAVFDQVLLSVHPDDCTVRDAFAARLLTAHQPAPAQEPTAQIATPEHPPSETLAREQRTAPAPGARLPTSPADLMLRVVNLIVDNYLDLRRELSRQLDHWQAELLRPRGRFANWSALLDARLTLHQLDEICEDQRAAVQDWVDTLETWALPDGMPALRELELLKVRSRDVLEHIERVVHHVRRLEQSTETAVQMHFSVQSNRTNDIMRTLTALTAVFLPLNLIAGIFGMNFEFIPLVHKQDGFWWAMATMTVIAIALVALFWRKRYLARTGQH